MKNLLLFNTRKPNTIGCILWTFMLLFLNISILLSQSKDSIWVNRIYLKSKSPDSTQSDLAQIAENAGREYKKSDDWYKWSNLSEFECNEMFKLLNHKLKTKLFDKVLYIDYFCARPKTAFDYQWILVEEWKFPNEASAQLAFDKLGRIDQSGIFFKYPIFWTFMMSKSSIVFMHSEELDQNTPFYSELLLLISKSLGCDIANTIRYRS